MRPGSISGVFRAPIRAIHTSGEQQLACLVYLERLKDEPDTIHVTAVEYSRRQREKLLRREFGSWLLEDHIEKSVIATDLEGNVGAFQTAVFGVHPPNSRASSSV